MAYILTIVALIYFGRRISMSVTMVFGGHRHSLSWLMGHQVNTKFKSALLVIVACHHFISSSLNVKESPSCNIWIIIKIILEKSSASWERDPDQSSWFDFLKVSAFFSPPQYQPQESYIIMIIQIITLSLIFYCWFCYHFIIDFLLSLYHWFFSLNRWFY